jgi:hypothetical protein
MPTNTRGFLDNISLFNILIVGLSALLGAITLWVYNIREEAIEEVKQMKIKRNRECGGTVLSGLDSDDEPVVGAFGQALNSVFDVSDSQRAEMSRKLNQEANDRMLTDQ